MAIETAYLAGGCFWGMEDLFRRMPGVVDTRVGYMGGDLANATYQQVKTGRTGHAEAIEVRFDTDRTSYRWVLEFFFQIHDPTTPERQGNDIGSQYRSAIFFTTPAQEATARLVKDEVDGSGRWPGRVVTEIAAAGPFWEAEPFHQDYLERNPGGYTCHWVRPTWVLDKKATAAE